MKTNSNSFIRQTITNPLPKLSGNLPKDDGGKVYITIDGVTFSTTVVEGKWSWQVSTPFIEGEHVVSVFVVDRAGNIGPSSQYLLTLDTLAPDAPTILQVYDNFGAHTGMLTPGDTTDDKTPTLKGVAEPGSSIIIYAGDKPVGKTTADKNGLWQLDVELENGTHELRAEATDSKNHTSEKSEPFTLTINAPAEGINIPPVITEVMDDVGLDQGLVKDSEKNLGYTDDNTPTLNGTGIPGQKVIIYDNGVKIGDEVIGSEGKWSYTVLNPLADGEHRLSVAHEGSDIRSPEWLINVKTNVIEEPDIGIFELLMAESGSLFIDNGKNQLLVNDDNDAAGKLRASLNNETSSWEQQNGSITVGGQQYQVYQHAENQTELLVLQDQ